MKHILSVLCLLAVSFWLQLYNAQTPDAYVEVLGVAQDGGFPHMGCNKEGCNLAWEHPELRRNVSSGFGRSCSEKVVALRCYTRYQAAITRLLAKT